ncbi:trypsin-like peptidase domain-containing protein [Paenibacillus sp. IB182496]|uniref:Trypsin-like peptidase domain-containing protein n=1 Tax=Paenibacillus sabuli TaxID=2772509 RepID=A0A927GQV4_9BACL|nr:trypsin-like peptidase domain-containing protein [Paenibacillus sabuli]MBD2844275.1 trypsin-like peptidase domain-containing protein [Paenibacillus sabuli]
MKKATYWLSLSLLATLLALSPLTGYGAQTAAAASSTAQSAITVYLDEEPLALDPAPVLRANTTLVPMRPIFEALGAGITWVQQTQTVIAGKDGRIISIKVGAGQAVVDGQSVELVTPAILIDGATMVPLRFVATVLGAEVRFAKESGEVHITSADAQWEEEYGEWEAPMALTASDIVAYNDDKVVMIETDRAQGSGVVIDEDLILTNYHVMADAASGTVYLWDGTAIEIAGITAYNEATDIAFVRTAEPLELEPVTVGTTYELYKGDSIVAIGSPLGLQNTVSQGLISNFYYDEEIEYLQFNAPIDHGSSGGALFDENGFLVGITTSKIEGTSAAINFAVSSLSFWEDLEMLDEPSFIASDLPDSLAEAELDEIEELMAAHFGTIYSSDGAAELGEWAASREGGWLVLRAELDPWFYTVYAESSASDMRLWALDTLSELQRMLPDQPIRLLVDYAETFDERPQGLDADEASLDGGKWQVRYPVIDAQAIGDKLHIDLRG